MTDQLPTEHFQERFGGIARLYGQRAAAALEAAHVCVVGIGGVGSWAAEALARSGVGAITLVDLDDICVTNTNRQIHTLVGTVGRMKVEVMAERVQGINPQCRVRAVHDFLTAGNIELLVTSEFSYVIDAIDNATVKAAVIAHCKRRKIGIVTTGGAGGKTDPTQIGVVDLSKTVNDPLAAKVRSMLRRFHNFSKNPKRHYSVPCVYSRQQLQYLQADGSVCQQKAGEGGRLDCAGGLGAATVVTATFGFVAVAKVIEKITGQ